MSLLIALSLATFQPVDPVACDDDSAERTTIEAVLAQPASLIGRCVTISGAPFGRYLTPEPMRTWPAVRLGIYSQHSETLAPNWTTVPRWHVTGMVDTCERLGRQGWDDARQRAATAPQPRRPPAPVIPPMLGGPCHYFNDVIIWVTGMRSDEAAD